MGELGGKDYKGAKETSGGYGCIIFLVKMISWVYTYVKINESVSFKCVQAECKTIF